MTVKSPRKRAVGRESSKTRAALLDAAELLMREEGYAAVTTRRLGMRAGLGPQLVHYYFRTMDDLFLALFRRRAECGLQTMKNRLASDKPLRAIWEQGRLRPDVSLELELRALARHRPVIRAEIVKFMGKYRRVQNKAVARYFELRGIKTRISPDVVTLLLSGVGLIIGMEADLGIRVTHAKTKAYVDTLLSRFDLTARPLKKFARPGKRQ